MNPAEDAVGPTTSTRSPALAILAGGASSRMGRDKAVLPFGGDSFLARIATLGPTCGLRTAVIGRSAPADWKLRDVAFMPDRLPGSGPLAALADALDWSLDAVLVVGCDMPALTPAAVRWLIAERTGDASVVATLDGQAEPLFAIYAPSCRASVARCLARGQRSLQALIADALIPLRELPGAHRGAVRNVNTPDDLARLPAAAVGA